MKYKKILAGVILISAALFAGCGKKTEDAAGAVGSETNLTVHEDSKGQDDAGSGEEAATGGSAAGSDAADSDTADGSLGAEMEQGSGAAGASDAEAADASGNVKKTSGKTASAATNTGNLTASGSGSEGKKATGTYNYGEALQKSLIFYELQRSGDLPEKTRCNWRGDSALNDGSDNGLDLSGGWYDAGDNVKFNLPMSYSAAVLGWSVYEDKKAYEESGQLEYALGNIKWANDYFIKCHPQDEVYYYQVGSGSADHAWWGPAELVEQQMARPSYAVTKSAPGSAVTGETAASLAICSILFKDRDAQYSKLCLQHAKSLYAFSESTKSDAGYTEANGFYNSWSGFYDELAWAGVWLYLATDDNAYLKKAEEYYPQAGQDYDWAMCWDDVHIGAAAMLAKVTGNKKYADIVEKHLDYWTSGTADGSRITYTPKGLAWLDNWGSLRYATTTGFVASVYSEWDICDSAKAGKYWDFALSQANYALGDTGFSYEIGFGDSYPVNPHHRTAQGSYCNNMNEPSPGRHILYGALVGGPDASDNYSDDVSNYNNNEVACDYNAGFTGLLANLYSRYHGETIKDFGAVETNHPAEIYAMGGINVDGQDFVEIKAMVYNESAWPARAPKNLELRYFVDLSEVYSAGAGAGQIEVTTNYIQSASAQGIKVWDEDKHLYYLSVVFEEGSIYPGGQENYKKEIQVRMRNPEGAWDNSNDPSFAGLSNGTLVMAEGMALYENGVLIYGSEPPAGANAGKSVGLGTAGASSGNNGGNGNNGSSGQSAPAKSGTASNENVSVEIKYDSAGGNSISGTMNITNNSDGSIALGDLAVSYYFTKDNDAGLNFACYHSAVTGKNGSYTGLNATAGTFKDCSGADADTECVITFGDSKVLEMGDTLTVNFCINHSDWSNFSSGNDYSAKKVENIVIKGKSGIIFGTKP